MYPGLGCQTHWQRHVVNTVWPEQNDQHLLWGYHHLERDLEEEDLEEGKSVCGCTMNARDWSEPLLGTATERFARLGEIFLILHVLHSCPSLHNMLSKIVAWQCPPHTVILSMPSWQAQAPQTSIIKHSSSSSLVVSVPCSFTPL